MPIDSYYPYSNMNEENQMSPDDLKKMVGNKINPSDPVKAEQISKSLDVYSL